MSGVKKGLFGALTCTYCGGKVVITQRKHSKPEVITEKIEPPPGAKDLGKVRVSTIMRDVWARAKCRGCGAMFRYVSTRKPTDYNSDEGWTWVSVSEQDYNNDKFGVRRYGE